MTPHHASEQATADRRILVVWNPVAGGAAEQEDLRGEVEAELDEQGGQLREWRDPDDATQWAASAADEGFRRVVAAGGDGTVAAVGNGLIEAGTGVPLGIVPLGTANVLAHFLRLPADPSEAFRLAVHGDAHDFDVGHIRLQSGAGRYFLLAFTAGLHADVVRSTERTLKRRLGALAYAWNTLRRALTTVPSEIRIEAEDGYDEQVRCHTVAVMNTGATRFVSQIAADMIEDVPGKLELLVPRPGTLLDVLLGLLAAILGRPRAPRWLLARSIEQLRISAAPALGVQVDGEPLGATPATIMIRRGALKIVRPNAD